MAPRARVLSFISQWGGGAPRSPTTNTSDEPATSSRHKSTPSKSAADVDSVSRDSPSAPLHQHSRSESFQRDIPQRSSGRPLSMMQTYNPPVMELAHDTLPELMPIFTYLNSHGNKLYQEGYFLMLHDLDTRGRPSANRQWTEVFAQLVGTVMSLWDAAQLDAAGADGEVVPTFINLADASIKMIPSLPMTGENTSGQTLQNVLSVSTAANNRYLLHFNSLNSLTQWTAGIRLSMYEHTTLQEAYTGSLIAGKGKTLNNVRDIMDRTRMKHDDWARVRFGAGTPWRRCWCVVNPPDEKEYAKLQKSMKKRGPYDTKTPLLKGDIKFYETKKITKRTRPIATITEAYSAYAIYPQSKPLIDQSTLVKIEGQITIHSKPESTTEGFVFVMPEVHPAVSGFEIMMRFLFPVFDTFGLYGRPQRLVAEPLDTRGLMFGMPKSNRYGYLELLDVAGLIHSDGAIKWTERNWRKQLKDLTSVRMTSGPSADPSGHRSRTNSRRATMSRVSLPPNRNSVRFNDGTVPYSQPSTRRSSPSRDDNLFGPRRVDSAPPPSSDIPRHQRSISENQYGSYSRRYQPRESFENPSPTRGLQKGGSQVSLPDGYETGEEGFATESRVPPELAVAAKGTPLPTQVEAPPAFMHKPMEKPSAMPPPPDYAQANAYVDPATLEQLADATHAKIPPSVAAAGAAAAWRSNQEGRRSGESDRNSKWRSDQRAYTSDQLTGMNSNSNRLPTIPASPYIEQGDPHASATASYEPTAPPVPEHGIPQDYQDITNAHPLGIANVGVSDRDGAQESQQESQRRPGSSPSVQRKPVPGRSSLNAVIVAPTSPTSSSLNSLKSNVIEPETYDRFIASERVLARAPSHSSSNYDNQSFISTDYASTDHASVRSAPPKPNVIPTRNYDKPRTGVLKTVGTVEQGPIAVGDSEYVPKPKGESDLNMLPTIDFGPTYAIRPGTSGNPHDRSRSRSRERLGEMTPGQEESNRLSYFGGHSPGASGRPVSRPSPNGSDSAGNRKSLVWQPGMVSTPTGGHQSKMSISADEWVQQRAAAANQSHIHAIPRKSPAPAHGHSPSGATPPLSRNASGDWSQLPAGHQRIPTSERIPSRPHSRGASVMMNQQSLVNTESANLSAREQEFVARATGTPMLQIDQKNQKQRPQSSGLIGAIEAREKEKRDLQSHGASGPLVQTAMHHRQQQQIAQHMRAASFGNLAKHPQSPIGLPMLQQQPPQQFYNSSPSMMNQYSPAPQMSPSVYHTPLQSPGYFPTPPQPQQQQFHAVAPQGRYSPAPQQFQGGGPQTFASQQMVPQAYGASWDAQQGLPQGQQRYYNAKR